MRQLWSARHIAIRRKEALFQAQLTIPASASSNEAPPAPMMTDEQPSRGQYSFRPLDGPSSLSVAWTSEKASLSTLFFGFESAARMSC